MPPSRNWDIAIVGECMASRPFSMHDDPGFTAILDLLRNADVTYGHLEMNLGEWDEVEWAARGYWLGSFMLAEPRIAQDLKWAGIDIMSLANNHSFGYGVSGLMATMKACKQAGLAHAGTGRDLEEAREPAYVEKKKGRVALISTTSGNKPEEWASLPKGTMRGRPGVNPLRVVMKYMVDQEAAKQLQSTFQKLGMLRKRSAGAMGVGFAEGEFALNMPGDQSMRSDNAFVAGDRFEVISSCHQRDLEANMRSIEEAVTMADLVMVAHHCNISDGPRGDDPPKFMREFAHACIDAGADIYLGHGWHRTLGIEIYKGKPIFYGLGDFFAQAEFIRRVPYDSYESWGHDVERLSTLTPAAHPLHPGMETPSETWWSSAVVKVKMEDGKLREVHLHPVEMGRDVTREATITRGTGRGHHPLTEGRPLIADPENGARILERYRRLSAPFGTEIAVEDGVGVIRL